MLKHKLFITFEGGEGAGKTTLIEGIFRHLTSSGYSVLKTREPGGTKMGEKIRSLLLEVQEGKVSPFAELSLFLAARAQHIDEIILPALEVGKIVLCDRFNDSSVAYQGVARNLGKEGVSQACQFISQGLHPDLTFYLDIEPSLGLSRVQRTRVQDRIEQEGLAFHAKIRKAYLDLVAENPKRMLLIDASLPKERVYQKAIGAINLLLTKA
jgi:dTMP kinase